MANSKALFTVYIILYYEYMYEFFCYLNVASK